MSVFCALLIGSCSTAASEHYMILFAHHSSKAGRSSVVAAHSFACFVEVTGDTISEQFTISWCSSNGVRLFQPAVTGVNRSLAETIDGCISRDLRISMWGPCRISADFFVRAREQYELLEIAESTGCVKWKALDGRSRLRCAGRAINCIHAISDISGVLVRTGSKCGESGSQAVFDCFVQMGLIADPCQTHDWVWQAIKPAGCPVVCRQ